MEPLTLAISGMSCGHCLNAVRNALASAAGVALESVQMGRAELRYDPALTSPAQIQAVVADAGYDAAVAGTGA
ncbi:MAG: heavy-metal-associated domain-containing protein [Gemmatimonadales bacterium]|jgi:copper chaperone|nr:heavy-metal-associated domain-containing protein [Gemmatimonadales bacterium]